jgi:replicative DNA helicase
MAETTENTLTAYYGFEFQQRLMWQLLVEPEFAEKIIPELAIEYFDDPNLKRLYIIILEYYKEFQKVPNLQNQSIHQAINKYKTPNNLIEEETLFSIVKRLELWNERIINKQMLYDGDVVQKSTNNFIKQQEYRKLSEYIQENVKNGGIKSKYTVNAIEEKFQKITHIGEDEDDCEDVTEGIDKALAKEFRKTIPTGIGVIDALTGGGLGKGEIGVILTPSGVGKTTALTVIANTAYEDEKNVAQIIFEDTKDQIKRKHYTIWADSALSRLNEDDENARVSKIVHDKAKQLEGKGRLIIKRFSQENTTMMDIRNWMTGYQKKYGFKFDILVLDYLDCLESHKKVPDRNEAELAIIKGFEALASDFDIPAWTAIQSNRSGFGAEFIEAHQSGGSIKRIQKSHFFMSVAKTQEQKEAHLANISILKARFAQDGQKFEDCIFNNDTMQIIIEDSRYKYSKTYKNLKHYNDDDKSKFDENAKNLMEKSSSLKLHEAISSREDDLIKKVNDDTVSDALNDAQKLNQLLYQNRDNSFVENKIDNIHISATRTLTTDEVKQVMEIANDAINESEKNDILILDDTDEEIIEGVNEGINDGVNSNYGVDAEEAFKKELERMSTPFEWNGESGSTTNEYTVQEEVDIHTINVVSKTITKECEVLTITQQNKQEVNNVDDIEKMLLIDPDEPHGEDKSVYNLLLKMRHKQDVIKKE